MKPKITIRMKPRIIWVLLGVLAFGGTRAQTRCNLSDKWNVVIHGNSNLHAWDETVGKVSCSSDIYRNTDGSFRFNALKLVFDVTSITSTEGSVMNEKTYKALKASRYPNIVFTLSQPVPSIPPGHGENFILAEGQLSIAGVTRPVSVRLRVNQIGSNELQFEGSQQLNMSDFDVDPPTAMFGMLKVSNQLTIAFKSDFILN